MADKKPFFSVVIPLYNKVNFIAATLQSVLQQTFQDFEIIIVDDGSTDHSLAKVLEFKDSRIHIQQQQNMGAAAARNRGVELAISSWVAFLDADDSWKENHLASHYKSIQKFPQEVVFTTRLSTLQQNKKLQIASYSFEVTQEIQLLPYFKNSFKSDLLNTSGLLINKSFFQKIGGFDEAIYSGQDTDLFIRIGLQKKIVFNPTASFIYNPISENNISKTPRFKERLAYLDAFQQEAENNPALEKYLDLNRFSIYLRSKMHGDTTWITAKHKLNKNNLSQKQIVMLALPQKVLRLLKYIQLQLQQLGIVKSAF